MDVSIVMPLYKADSRIISMIDSALKKQKKTGRIELIKVDKGLGLADSMNYGIKKAKYSLIVTLHQDCVPSSNTWLKDLLQPFKNEKVVASVSKVHMPKSLWDSFDYFAKILSIKEQQILTPLLDEKGCAYRKSALVNVGLFDGKTFRTAGEDFDMYIKIKKLGEVVYPEAKVIHYHSYTFWKRIKKELQLANASGALLRKYGKLMPGWYKRLARSLPIVGWPFFWPKFPYNRMIVGGIVWLLLSLPVNLLYSYGFWKGFIQRKQSI